MHYKTIILNVALVTSILLASCADKKTPGSGQEGDSCDKSSDCTGSLICQDGTCQKAAAAPKDEPKDSSSDAKSDEACKGTDCNTDAPIENLENCGNGRLDNGEGCDDGARKGGDGCSANCQVESHWMCTNSDKYPSICECAAGFDPDKNCADCLTNHFGSKCEPCATIGGKICSNHGFCNDGIKGKGDCTCAQGYEGEICNKSKCPEGYKPTAQCNECLAGLDIEKECKDCLPGHYGEKCDGTCPGMVTVGETEVPCNNQGTCIDGKEPKEGLGTCTCNNSVSGADCSGCKGNHTNYPGGCQECIPGFVGADCDLECPGHATGAICGGRGTCKELNGQAVCDSCEGHFAGANCELCATGWTGDNCDECDEGYYGPNCQLCPSCNNHGTCATGIENTSGCNCNEGWTGATCNDCESGYYGYSCKKCECGTHSTACSDGKSGTGCICAERYTGEHCDQCTKGYFAYGRECVDCTKTGGSYDYVLPVKCTYTDSRDNHSYKVVKIGDQLWMAENLRYDKVTDHLSSAGNSSNDTTYGYLYAYKTFGASCPSGWVVPKGKDFDQLMAYVKSFIGSDGYYSSYSGAYYAAKSYWNFDFSAVTLDAVGFGALPAGMYSTTLNKYIGYKGYLSSNGASGQEACFLTRCTNSSGNLTGNTCYFGVNDNSSAGIYSGDKAHYYSVRCLKEY